MLNGSVTDWDGGAEMIGHRAIEYDEIYETENFYLKMNRNELNSLINALKVMVCQKEGSFETRMSYGDAARTLEEIRNSEPKYFENGKEV